MSKHKIYKEGSDTSCSADIPGICWLVSEVCERDTKSGLCHRDAMPSLSGHTPLLVSANFQTQAGGKCQLLFVILKDDTRFLVIDFYCSSIPSLSPTWSCLAWIWVSKLEHLGFRMDLSGKILVCWGKTFCDVLCVIACQSPRLSSLTKCHK